MSDKENVEKENEQFSSSILYVATVVYVGVCAMVFGALCARHQSFGDAFLKLMEDYGTILTGIPVLVAVVVAKQQLDAMRRQHVATIKRSFKETIDALDHVKKYIKRVKDHNPDYIISVMKDYDRAGTYIMTFPAKTISMLSKTVDNNIIYFLHHVNTSLNCLYESQNSDDRAKNFAAFKSGIQALDILTDVNYKNLEKYWS